MYGNTGTLGAEIYLSSYDSDPATITVSYSNVQGGPARVYVETGSTLNWKKNNINTDPLFVDPSGDDLHLKSLAGRYCPETGLWVIDDVTSPCIDAGNPSGPIGLEPFANGGYVNMGAYGATAEASKTYFGTEPCEVIVAGDINGDCMIDMVDLSFLASNWLVDNTSK